MLKRDGINFPIWLFWVPSILVLLSALVVVSACRNTFNGELSSNSADWANFGSYFGGLLGSIISLVTLGMATAVLYYTFLAVKNAARSEQKTVVHQLLMVWLSEYMVRDRNLGWEWFDNGKRNQAEEAVLEVGGEKAVTPEDHKR
jgi:hypothetical protein